MSKRRSNGNSCSYCQFPGCRASICPLKHLPKEEARRVGPADREKFVRAPRQPSQRSAGRHPSWYPCNIVYYAALESGLVHVENQLLHLPYSLYFGCEDDSWLKLYARSRCTGRADAASSNKLRLCENCHHHAAETAPAGERPFPSIKPFYDYGAEAQEMVPKFDIYRTQLAGKLAALQAQEDLAGAAQLTAQLKDGPSIKAQGLTPCPPPHLNQQAQSASNGEQSCKRARLQEEPSQEEEEHSS